MSNFEACQPIELVQSKYCEISHCNHCGAYHINIGYASLRLSEEVFKCISQAFLDVQKQQAEYKFDQEKPTSH